MFWRKRKPPNRNLQLARSDYLIHRVRELLPGAYIAHEKRAAPAQLDAVTLVSTGGMYMINTFDLHAHDRREHILTCGDVVVAYGHVPGTHQARADDAIAAAIADANRQFEEQLSSAAPGFENRVVRLTCEMEFVAEGDIDQTARQIFDKLAQHAGAEAIAWPYSLHDLFVPGYLSLDTPIVTEYPGATWRCGEIIFPEPRTDQEVVETYATVIPGLEFPVFAPGFRCAAVPQIPLIKKLHLVARHF